LKKFGLLKAFNQVIQMQSVIMAMNNCKAFRLRLHEYASTRQRPEDPVHMFVEMDYKK
jgi:hypothetical protein